jgi:hypothetical protein
MEKENNTIRYYLVKDLTLIKLFSEYVERLDEALEDIECFVETYAPKAKLNKINTEGNLGTRYVNFNWYFNSLEDIPSRYAYKNFVMNKNGLIGELNVKDHEGRKIQEELKDLVALISTDLFELWAGEIAPIIGVNYQHEPGLLYNEKQRLFIVVMDKEFPIKKFGTGPKKPFGMVEISKDKAYELLDNIH